MAGTPTPNYQFPTYAETDTPNLAGAYNQAVNAIDAKIKEVADTIPSDVDVPDATSTTKGIAKLYDSTTVGESTQDDGGITPAAMKGYVDAKVPAEQQEYTAGTGILIEGTKISARGAYTVSSDTIDTVESTGLPADSPGTVVAACSESALVDRIVAVNDAEHKWPGGAVPTVQVLKDYVESKMAAAGAAYTGTAPVVVDNGSHAISVNTAENASTVDGTTTYGTPGTVLVAGDVQTLVGAATDAAGSEHVHEAERTVPNCITVKAYTEKHVSDAQKADLEGATQQLTVDKLTNLWVNPATGSVFYKAPTE